uniref:Uncharacterized protein LOC116951598 n=1 Tax=Petromyzon marinus TaxID=7757 RepID=A0AAJ7U0X5_PETMA|nr:uncharacterized protein LOC116951598 [Petromyzon marinus]XP_032826247.1 uncharacterized protein LOC116951598 [Petromyzon marinus]
MVVGGSSELKISLGDIFKKFNRAPVTQGPSSQPTSPGTRDEPSGAEKTDGKGSQSRQDDPGNASDRNFGASKKLQERAVNGRVVERGAREDRCVPDKSSDAQPECALRPAQVDQAKDRRRNGEVIEQGGTLGRSNVLNKLINDQLEKKLSSILSEKLQQRMQNGEVIEKGGMLEGSNVLNESSDEQLKQELSLTRSEKLKERRRNGEMIKQRGMLEAKGVSIESNIKTEKQSHELSSGQREKPSKDKRLENKACGESGENGDRDILNVSNGDLPISEVKSTLFEKPLQEDKAADNVTTQNGKEMRDLINESILNHRSGPGLRRVGLQPQQKQPQQQQTQQEQPSQGKRREQWRVVEPAGNQDAAADSAAFADPPPDSSESVDSDESAQEDSTRSVVWNGVMEELRDRAAAKKAASFRLINRSSQPAVKRPNRGANELSEGLKTNTSTVQPTSDPSANTSLKSECLEQQVGNAETRADGTKQCEPSSTIGRIATSNGCKPEQKKTVPNDSITKQGSTVDLSKDSIHPQASVAISSRNSEPPVQRSRGLQCGINKGTNLASQDRSAEPQTEKPVSMSKTLESTQLEKPLRCETDQCCTTESQSPTKPASARSPISCPLLQSAPLQHLNKPIAGDRPVNAQVKNQAIGPMTPPPTNENTLCSSKMVITLSSGWGKTNYESTPANARHLSRSTSQVSISQKTSSDQGVYSGIPPAYSNGTLSPTERVPVGSLQTKQDRSSDHKSEPKQDTSGSKEDFNESRTIKEVSKLSFNLSGPTSPTTSTAGKTFRICNPSTDTCQSITANIKLKESVPENVYVEVKKPVASPLASPISSEVHVVKKDSVNRGQTPTAVTPKVQPEKCTPMQTAKQLSQLNGVSAEHDSTNMTVMEDQEPSRTHSIRDDQLQSNGVVKQELKKVTHSDIQPKQEPRKPQCATDLGSNKKGMDLEPKGGSQPPVSAAAAAGTSRRPRVPLSNNSSRECGVGGPRVPPGSGGCVGGLRSAWEQWSDDYTERQKLNPFSQRFDMEQALSTLPQKGEEGYGRPKEGTRTAERAARAQQDVRKEMLEMCYLIRRIGEPGSDGRKQVAFGHLFHTYARVSDKLVGILLRARKHGLVDFEGEMLWQGRDDHVQITLLS